MLLKEADLNLTLEASVVRINEPLRDPNIFQ